MNEASRRLGLALLLSLGLADRSNAQPIVYGDTVVEVLGLKTWTPQQVEAAVKEYAPGVSLASAACAVILRDSIGFADAAVTTYSTGGDTVWTAIRVLEPADSTFVRYTRGDRGERPLPARWEAVHTALSRNPRAVSYFQNPDFLLDAADSIYGQPVQAEALEARTLLRALSTEDDYADAVDILRHVRNAESRQLAALVASNFADRDAAWHALVEAFRAGSDQASALAQMVFRGLSRSGRFRVDWEKAEDALEAVIGGTNLFAYDDLLSGLVDTELDPGMARQLARVNPEQLVDHATAMNRFVRGAARRFLTHAGVPDAESGRDELLEWIHQQ
jgi:hypothetical protein